MSPEGFEELVRPLRRELAAHCYRMLGSLADAEDQVQETLLRAWRGIDGFEGRSSVKSWLYRIATNACLDVLRQRPRRVLPHELGEPHDPRLPLPARTEELLWVQPAPASLIGEPGEAGPEARYAARESVQLAFVVALQHLPAQQRAAVILRDVLGWSAAEVAELLDTTVAAVNSALQRGRETLDARRARTTARLDEAGRDALVARYVAAWENGDVDALAALLHHDVITSMPPIPGWFRGRDPLVDFTRANIGAPGARRLVLGRGADEIAIGFYRNDRGTPDYLAHALQIVLLDGEQVRELHVFLDTSLFERFGLPPILR
jgi:RNA polymerase sigma-70 factor, ECF subfamily